MCASCTHRIETVHTSTPIPGAATATATAMSRQVQNAVDAGEGDLELRQLRQRLAANADDLDARILLARLYLRHGLPDVALEHQRFAARQFPDSAIAALELAKNLRQSSQNDEAIKVVANFSAKHPGASWEILSLQGILEDERGDLAAGEQSYRAALAIDANRSALHNNLGYNLLLQGKPQDAAGEFRRAIELDPRSQIAHNNLGAALIAAKAPTEALAEWQRTSGLAAAHNNLAAVWIEQGHYPEARAELNAALQAKPDFPPAIANLKLIAARDGKPSTIPQSNSVGFWKHVTSSLGWFVAPVDSGTK